MKPQTPHLLVFILLMLKISNISVGIYTLPTPTISLYMCVLVCFFILSAASWQQVRFPWPTAELHLRPRPEVQHGVGRWCHILILHPERQRSAPGPPQPGLQP